MESYKDVFQALDKAKVSYIIVGGVAMNLLGCPRFTNDIDILLALNERNITKMNKVMESLGYERRIPVALDELGDEKKAVKFVKEKNLLAYTFYNPKEPLYSLDIIVDESLQFDKYRKNLVYKEVWGISLPVVSIDDLIGLKRKSDREKDAMDVASLLEYKGL
ncbi:nucleotidyl transferase AbiEii/AbiGii toxin family protein [Patescibacteria group bacterium]|nr:nucleotidyl transferase AbiEii/AbiGii toxin family protein [Patescibacteria group bacterium]MBU1123532.1 nucleotidyl transferase AbiEii/AbiGii toxin family protein [Patescibacteria group bacterium]MBU1911869.1 nucleotidyl transferase AbiEii/AbiGii toxin family protein [Patescibacteria group bacterium]